MNKVGHCEVCGSKTLQEVIDLGLHPMCDDLVPINDGRMPVEYPISILYCETCRTAHQAYQIPKRTLFPSSYHYRARHTADVLNGMKQLVDRCERLAGALQGRKVVDIGCNDGSLLSIFAEKGARTIGIEPTGAAADARAAGHTIYEDYLTPTIAATVVADQGQPDVVTFTNVFAHIEDLSEVLQSLRALMGPDTMLIIENHYLGAVLDRYQFDTFYHEHPRTYSFTSFKYIAEALGLDIIAAEFPQRYGGNVRVIMRRDEDPRNTSVDGQSLPREEDFGRRLGDMGLRISSWRDAKRAQIAKAVLQYGALPAKAFPGRAAILVKVLGLDETMVSAAYEKPGSMKVGHYIPGTRIPILSDEAFDARENKEAPVLNLAWHISAEIHNYLRSRGYNGQILDIFSVEEFVSSTVPSSIKAEQLD